MLGGRVRARTMLAIPIVVVGGLTPNCADVLCVIPLVSLSCLCAILSIKGNKKKQKTLFHTTSSGQQLHGV